MDLQDPSDERGGVGLGLEFQHQNIHPGLLVIRFLYTLGNFSLSHTHRHTHTCTQTHTHTHTCTQHTHTTTTTTPHTHTHTHTLSKRASGMWTWGGRVGGCDSEWEVGMRWEGDVWGWGWVGCEREGTWVQCGRMSEWVGGLRWNRHYSSRKLMSSTARAASNRGRDCWMFWLEPLSTAYRVRALRN